jgi:D-arabinose 1-dehydrogenase-like Zn-dependent alcohol dehydrogenase
LVMVSKDGMLEIELGAHGMEDMMVCTFYTAYYLTNISFTTSGTCHACKKGLFQMCDNRTVNGETKDGGCT